MLRVHAARVTVCALLSALAPAAVHASGDEYVDGLVERARAMELAEHRQWLRLGHWRSGLFGGFESDADGARFFVVPEGADDPAAELDATIHGFFSPPADDDDHPRCRFPARFDWLDDQLGFDHSRIRQKSCPGLEEFLGVLDAKSATLVFSAYYLSNAASAFGHTLLRINKQTSAAGEERRQLLDMGINYSAQVDTGNAILYAFKGITGMFTGNFQRMPYYYKVREYNDFESRDLWEYELSLRGAVIDRLVKHLWELGSTHFDYYYLSENCSYHLLSALEAADPELELLDHVKWPVIPADTIKALFHNRGLVTGVQFRPSLRSQFRERVAGLDSRQRELVATLQRDPDAPAPRGLSTAQLAAVLDAAIDALDMHHGEDVLRSPDGEHAQRRLELMGRRAALSVASPDLSIALPVDQLPHRGHGSQRLGLGSGLRGDDPYASLHLRLALHDLADPGRGYPGLSQIEFLPTELRYWPGDERATLERLSLVSVVNLVPLTRFDRKFSWQLRAGGRRMRGDDCEDCFAGQLEFGAGGTVATAGEALAVFAMADAELLARPGLDVLGPTRLGLGGVGGMRLALSSDVVALGQGGMWWQPRAAQRRTWRAQGTLRWQYFADLALSADVVADHDALEVALSWLLYR